ncbi:cell division protein ZapA [Undibacterium sp. RTI2.1]|uniref:cell division protein ZapA n=1 Tax=unclassified Undibacterium TaxID=2630295 RepID=UPI002AB44954|nr:MULTISPECIES: cell division protein ZapA [unclassified Undibacterium]MDY7536946.1 cell division protein ZapA [Undibacterium sp. 5I1]MEB0032936.1 cell division protein ZapA [Undibacterium sp. RTI2.1]MEB0117979.1 cell division protein ZapA [Undibacterium sp. RTI2.2]MEB0229522.1 cell division protein ZapA [Undibacterium sp. 10I3]MEB0258875.1 cell division protein ZapA [Undibacterium sp. 5I1]
MIQLDVSIMGQAYKLSCKEGEDKALLAAVAYLNEKMCTIRDAAKIKGNDRIAVMAALGVTAELLSTKSPEGPLSGLSIADVKQKINHMHEVLDKALTPQENLF